MAPCQLLLYPSNLRYNPSYILKSRPCDVNFCDVINEDHNVRLQSVGLSTVNFSNIGNMEGQKKGFLSSISAAIMNFGFGDNNPKYSRKMHLISSRAELDGFMPSNCKYRCSHKNQNMEDFFTKVSISNSRCRYQPSLMMSEKHCSDSQCSPLRFGSTNISHLGSMGWSIPKAGYIPSVFTHNMTGASNSHDGAGNVPSKPLDSICDMPVSNSKFTTSMCNSILTGITSSSISDLRMNPCEVTNRSAADLGFRCGISSSSILYKMQDLCRISAHPQKELIVNSDQDNSNMYSPSQFVMQSNQTGNSVSKIDRKRKVPNKGKIKTINERALSQTSLCDVLQTRPGKCRKKSRPSSEKRRRKKARQLGLFLSNFKSGTNQQQTALDDRYSCSDNCSDVDIPHKPKLNKILYRQPSNSTVNARLKHSNMTIDNCMEFDPLSDLIKEFTFQVSITSDDDVDDVLEFSSTSQMDFEFMFPCLTLDRLEPLNIHIDCAVSGINHSPQASPIPGLTSIKAVNARWDAVATLETLPPNMPKAEKSKKVTFDSDNLETTYPMFVWDYAYRAARIGPWEESARDRIRFQQRIADAEKIISPILTIDHRTKVSNSCRRFD